MDACGIQHAAAQMPVLALRGLTVFPGMMLTFEVERSMSIAALNMAMSDDQIIYLVPQKDIATDYPVHRTMCTAWARSAASSR